MQWSYQLLLNQSLPISLQSQDLSILFCLFAWNRPSTTKKLKPRCSFVHVVNFSFLFPFDIYLFKSKTTKKKSLREKYPNTEFFLVRIFSYPDWIRTKKNSIFRHFSRSTRDLRGVFRTWTVKDETFCENT